MNKRWFNTSGLTLMEVLSGILVAAILGASAMPSVSELLGSYQLISASNLVAAEIARAQTQASAQQRYVCVYMQDSEVRRQVADAAATDCTVAGAAPEITELRGVTVSRSEVRFDPSGIAVVRNSAKVANATGSNVVVTSVLGQVVIL